MASHDQRQSFRAGETKGRTEEKTKQMMSNVGEKAQAAKEKVKGTMGQPTKDSAHSGGPGVMQNTGEKVKGMAHGASEAVKGTFGMGQAHHDDQHKYHPADY